MKHEDIIIHQPKDNKIVPWSENKTWRIYTGKGVDNVSKENGYALEEIASNGRRRYLVAFQNGRLYNPKMDSKKFSLEWRKVSIKCFNYYKQFLLNGRDVFFVKSEREIINGS